jgi:hypothetical protein
MHTIIDPLTLNDISDQLLLPNGKMKLLPTADLKNLNWNDFRHFCHVHGRYGVPTVELIEMLTNLIGGRSCIEIGAGNGDFGYHLNLRMTDSKIQDELRIKNMYRIMRQPTIQYPRDVEKLEALEAIYKYKPQVVITSWTTTYFPRQTSYHSNPYGLREERLLNLVDTYILIGNLDTHGDKPICKLPHQKIQSEFIVSRAANQENNRVFVWNKT